MNRDDLAVRLLAIFVGELEEQVAVMNVELLALEKAPGDGDRLAILFRVAHTLKGAASAAGVPAVERACHALETMLAAVREGTRSLGSSEFAWLFASVDALAAAGRRLRAGHDLSGAPIASLADPKADATVGESRPAAPATARHSNATREDPPGDGRGSQVRVDGEKLDLLLAATSQLIVARERVGDRPAGLRALHDTATRSATEWRRASRRVRQALTGAAAPPELVRAITSVEDGLQHVVREAGRLASQATADAGLLAQVSNEVADRVRRLRLRPFAEVCEPLPRAVRDLSTRCGKAVDLEVRGGEVEVDRAVLDGLRDALLHLVRNAVDHGIESPVDRTRAGKPDHGTVRLEAALRGDRLVVMVADDGRGLAVAALREQLARRGRAVPDDERELAHVLFESGVSTQEQATDVSGRGVGLDIVRAALARIRGRVDVSWVPGQGTTFVLECPTTLATVRALLVTVGGQTFAIPSADVDRLLRVRPDDIRHVEGREVIVTSDAPVPLVPLARLLPPLPERPAVGPVKVALLHAGTRRLAVVVDDLIAEQEIVTRPIAALRAPLSHLSGAAMLSTGHIALVLDAAAVVSAGLGLRPGRSVVAPAPAVSDRCRILVVDDSLTTRTLEQSILETAGYEVRTAVDGADAWRVLQDKGSDLVVADVEMPVMDGFALCEAIRGSSRFKTLPVVLVTALETSEHRTRGLEAGAHAYLGKSSFDQQRLLDTIADLLGQPGACR